MTTEFSRKDPMRYLLIVLLLMAIPAWACKPPDDLAGWAVQAVTHEAATLVFVTPTKGTVVVKIQSAPLNWDTAFEVPCPSSPCRVTGLAPGTTYDVQAIPALLTKTQGLIYGNRTAIVTFTTLPTVTLKDSLLTGFTSCVERKLANTACNKAMVEAIRKATQ